MLPDGSVAPIDDSTPGARQWYGGYVDATWPHAGLFRWAWEVERLPSGGQVEPFLVASFDDSVPSVSPVEAGLAPTQILPYAGEVAFRSGWGADDTLALLIAEHGKAAAWSQTRWGQLMDSNGGHEHPDGTSFSLYAGGETLALDSGYLGWPNHSKVNEAVNHSLVLVDGRGPSGSYLLVPPFILDEDGNVEITDPTVEGGWMPSDDGQTWLVGEDALDADLGYADVVSTWFGDVPRTDVERRATFLAGRFLVLHDRLVTADGATHRYAHQIHTHCGGTGGGLYEPTADGALCTRPGARLSAIVLSPSPAERGAREAIHDEGGWAERTHDVLETSVTVGGGPAEFLSVLIPEPATVDGYDAVDTIACGELCRAWTHAGLACEAWTGGPREVVAPSGTRLVTADSGAYCGDGDALYGSFVGLDGDGAASITARFAFTPDGDVASWRIRVHAFDPALPRATITVPAVAGTEPAGACAWTEDAGRWRIDAIGDARTATHAPAVVARLAIAGRSAHDPHATPVSEAVTLDASVGCAPSTATYAWTLVDRPEVSTVELPAADGPTLTFVPDLPGVWRIRVQVDDAAGSDVAEIAFEAVGEPIPAVGDTDTDSDADTDAVPRKCGCDHGGIPWLGAWAILLVVRRARAERPRR